MNELYDTRSEYFTDCEFETKTNINFEANLIFSIITFLVKEDVLNWSLQNNHIIPSNE